ncbi:MAG: tRNA (adenosine(37)-N6)-threonylcarbamoyltransferase complex transferase subunit TsaD [Phycisphaeraceae bacterium]|nr:tRNA (adenosine(37)-N6)-threonylcarbamoyltransferase complex transferase subunit TsaD [Phycisphaeraceae bacterium]
MAQVLRVLGVETSCDETAASVVDLDAGRLRVRSNVVSSQIAVHAEYGGVVPELASRAHLERLLPTLRAALEPVAEGRACRETLASLDAIAVASRPGLIGSLLVGTSAAKALAWSIDHPVLAVDHVAAHLVGAMLDAEPVAFPSLGLVVSGGHTALFLMRDALTLEPLAGTPDDAVGEAFDKGAALLGLPYPGGPQIERLAARGDSSAVKFPVPQLDFSFSGLKTALLHEIQPPPRRAKGRADAVSGAPLTDDRRADLAASYQRALVRAVIHGMEHLWSERWSDASAPERPKTLLVGGGVAANGLLRSELAAFANAQSIALQIAPLHYCLDNAAMIAGVGALRAARGERDPLDFAPQPISLLRPTRTLSVGRPS